MAPLDRLHKVLAHAGFGSRRTCERLIAAGSVQVDGKTVTEMGVKVDPTRQKIKCEDRYVRMPVTVAYMLHKPMNVVSTTNDEQGRRTVVDLMRGVRVRLYPAGRLDADSHGLVIMTNDGDLCDRLTHPRFRVPKTYHVVIRGEVAAPILEKVRKGVWLSEGKTGPVSVHVAKRTREVTVLEVTIHEGMNREIRRIFARWGYKVKRLTRIRVGGLTLGPLPEGQFRKLTAEDLARVVQADEAPKGRARAAATKEE